ncbi:hypothetical protein AURDEDRAFT_152833 [Auricularia subglabra TFB-10046 SS5]|nr:hypothetical protein AURDEDRAFT_152833 [Auricularia subglabra TFB-10046 SS5]
MPPKQRELTRNQVSSRLAYNASTPAFLQRMQAQVSRQTGRRFGNDDENDEDDEAPQVEFESLDAERPAIPVRPRSPKPQRGAGRRGSRSGSEKEDEEPEDERPQVIVLKEGKHLTKEEAENEKRIAQGLPPLPINKAPADDANEHQTQSQRKDHQKSNRRNQASNSMAFGTSSRKDDELSAAKRRAAAIGSDDDGGVGEVPATKKAKTKAKKLEKKLLSFDDDG